MEKLAYIQTIANITPINGADNIVQISFKENGWECIAKKDSFQKGDMCVFIEIDSIVPETSNFEFLRKNKFRVNTMKLNKFGVISQGLALPISEFKVLDGKKLTVGDDITQLLGVKKYTKTIEATFVKETPPKEWYRWIWWKAKQLLYVVFPNLKTPDAIPFPNQIVAKTDEENIQNLIEYNFFEKYKNEDFIYTEKLEGTSITLIYKDKKFRVCSRKLELITKDDLYWQTTLDSSFDKKMKQISKDLSIDTLVFQGELIGKPQGNYYELSANEIRIFNVEINNKKLNIFEFQHILDKYNIKYVPILGEVRLGNYDLQSIIKFAEGQSILNNNIEREGLVFSMKSNPKISFKVVSNKFRINKGE